MNITEKEKIILRELGKRVAEIAALPVQQEKAEMWGRLNGLDPVRPMVHWHMEDLCWVEVLPDDVLVTTSDICRDYERYLRRVLYIMG